MTLDTKTITTPPLISIIIPTRNSERTIKICLESIKRQIYSRIEIIIVDQQSKDNTIQICKRYDTQIIITSPTKFYIPPSRSRNIGTKNANGKYLLHLDSDMELTASLVEECVNRFESGGFGAIVIHETDITEGFWGLCKALERKCIVGDPILEGARFVKTEIFHKAGGYDENLSSGEDWDIHQRYNEISEIGVANAVIRHHIGCISLTDQILKKYHYGKTMWSYIDKYPQTSKRQLFLRSAYLKNWKYLMSDPIHAIGFFFLKSCEYFAALMGLITSTTPSSCYGDTETISHRHNSSKNISGT